MQVPDIADTVTNYIKYINYLSLNADKQLTEDSNEKLDPLVWELYMINKEANKLR